MRCRIPSRRNDGGVRNWLEPRVWDVSDPRRPREIEEWGGVANGATCRLAVSHDGRMMATAAFSLNDVDFPASLWDVSELNNPVRLGMAGGHAKWIFALGFSPDGKTLATGGDDGTFILIDVTDPRHPRQLGQPVPAHAGTVSSLVFMPGGHALITASDDHTIRVWDITDLAAPRPVGPPLTAAGAVNAMALSPDGHTLVTGGDDAAVTFWSIDGSDSPGDDLLQRACAFAGRGLNEDEWRRYLDMILDIDICSEAVAR